MTSNHQPLKNYLRLSKKRAVTKKVPNSKTSNQESLKNYESRGFEEAGSKYLVGHALDSPIQRLLTNSSYDDLYKKVSLNGLRTCVYNRVTLVQ